MRLTRNNAEDTHPTWSPDGSQIAFASNRTTAEDIEPNFDIYIMNADGSEVSLITTNPANDMYPDWKPQQQ
jgi:Tol biopolymer transport system component